jgi:hypothetical protein
MRQLPAASESVAASIASDKQPVCDCQRINALPVISVNPHLGRPVLNATTNFRTTR